MRLHGPSLIREKKYSRFRNATRYQLCIAFNEIEDATPDNNEPFLGYYFACKSKTKTFGTWAQTASVLWFLGYAHHQPHVIILGLAFGRSKDRTAYANDTAILSA